MSRYQSYFCYKICSKVPACWRAALLATAPIVILHLPGWLPACLPVCLRACVRACLRKDLWVQVWLQRQYYVQVRHRLFGPFQDLQRPLERASDRGEICYDHSQPKHAGSCFVSYPRLIDQRRRNASIGAFFVLTPVFHDVVRSGRRYLPGWHGGVGPPLEALERRLREKAEA